MLNASPITLHHAHLLHQLYLSAPAYFELLGTPVPSQSEVEREVDLALLDAQRRLELLWRGEHLIGALDTKRHFPRGGDLTINLLLIAGPYQGQGFGTCAARDLERRLPTDTKRLLASVLGNNVRAARFWRRQGYRYAIDARPVMEWYAKDVGATVASV